MLRQLEFYGMLGRSPAMQEVCSLIQRLAPHARSVLISGETGTGKELAARAFHQAGPRRAKVFVTVNCSAVIDTLFESELFGHVRGAFTGAVESKAGMFEAAQGGTLFLDEVGELPFGVQAKLLRALENGEVQRVGSLQSKKMDVAVIAATNRDLRAEVAAGRFRGDLFYRLNVVGVTLPPLRDRRRTFLYLTAAFIRECSERLRKPVSGVTPSVERVLLNARWDGNVRELKNAVERACILAEGAMISERELAGSLGRAAAARSPQAVEARRAEPRSGRQFGRPAGDARRSRAGAHSRRPGTGPGQPDGGGQGPGHQPASALPAPPAASDRRAGASSGPDGPAVLMSDPLSGNRSAGEDLAAISDRRDAGWYRALFLGAADAMLILDDDRRVLDANPSGGRPCSASILRS